MLKKKLQAVIVVLILVLLGQVAQASGSYVVQRGDTLWLIAQRHNTTVNALAQENRLNNVNMIEVGQTLILPGSDLRLHIVRPGETLWLISRQYNVTLDALCKQNNIVNANLLLVGTPLAIPNSGVISVVQTPPAAPTTIASRSGRVFSASELDLFARIVHAESAGESYIGQVAVAATILNRIDSSRYPNTMSGVVYQIESGYYQYSPVLDGRINLPANESARRAVRAAIDGQDPSLGATGFYNPRKTSNVWVRQQPVTTIIGDHVFFR
jgi:N-acetylmuramoyl-L-alanine amidase